MELTEEQKAEIKDYIITVPRYRETYNELYDHILNSLKDNDGSYSINEVTKVINNDFGGFSEIVNQEKLYQKQINKRYIKMFNLEMLNTFKWPEIVNNLGVIVLCFVLYHWNKNEPFNSKLIFLGSFICCVIVAVFGFYKICINKYKYSKYSILDNYFGYECSFGAIITNAFLQLIISKTSVFGVEINDHIKLIATLILFSFCSIYVRAFIKFYNQKLKVLTV